MAIRASTPIANRSPIWTRFAPPWLSTASTCGADPGARARRCCSRCAIPRSTRTVILDGAVALTMGFPRTASADAQAALDRLIDRLPRGRRAAATAFPDPRAELDRFFRRDSAAATVTVTIRHPRTHAPAAVTLSRGVATDIIRGALYTPQRRRRGVVSDQAGRRRRLRAAAGATGPHRVGDDRRHGPRRHHGGAVLGGSAVRCRDRLRGRSGGIGIRHHLRRRLARPMCRLARAATACRSPPTITSEVPALILSGGHDPVTPPRAGELMTRHFPRHRHVVVPNAAHNASFSGCVPGLIAKFLADGHGDDAR